MCSKGFIPETTRRIMPWVTNHAWIGKIALGPMPSTSELDLGITGILLWGMLKELNFVYSEGIWNKNEVTTSKRFRCSHWNISILLFYRLPTKCVYRSIWSGCSGMGQITINHNFRKSVLSGNFEKATLFFLGGRVAWGKCSLCEQPVCSTPGWLAQPLRVSTSSVKQDYHNTSLRGGQENVK